MIFKVRFQWVLSNIRYNQKTNSIKCLGLDFKKGETTGVGISNGPTQINEEKQKQKGCKQILLDKIKIRLVFFFYYKKLKLVPLLETFNSLWWSVLILIPKLLIYQKIKTSSVHDQIDISFI